MAQDPKASQFLEQMVLYDKVRYLTILLSQGAKLPQGFDTNTLRSTSPNTNVHIAHNMIYSVQTPNAMSSTFFDTTMIVHATSNIPNNSNTINTTSIKGSQATTMPIISTTLSQLVGTTFGSLTMLASNSNPLFTTIVNAMGASSIHNNPPLTVTSTTMSTPLTYPLIGISQNPLEGGKRCIFIQENNKMLIRKHSHM